MRAFALLTLLLATALFTAACGGPDDPTTLMAEACERQIEETAAEHSDTPTAKSTEERLKDETLIECAGQHVKVVAADAAADAPEGEGEGTTTVPEGTIDEDGGEEGTIEGETPAEDTEGAEPAELDPAARELFASSCGSCHALSDAESTGSFGPNLDETQMDADAIKAQIENGGGGMPANLLEGEDADAVAAYVAAAAAA